MDGDLESHALPEKDMSYTEAVGQKQDCIKNTGDILKSEGNNEENPQDRLKLKHGHTCKH